MGGGKHKTKSLRFAHQRFLETKAPHYIGNTHPTIIYTPELSLPRVCHRQRADPSELRVELRPLRVELLAYVQKVTGTDPVLTHGP